MWHRLRFFSLRTIPHGSPELFWTLLVERSWCDRLEKIAQLSVRVSIAITRPISHVEYLQRMALVQEHSGSFVARRSSCVERSFSYLSCNRAGNIAATSFKTEKF